MSALPALLTRAKQLGRPLVLGHRGASALVTENTMAAFHRAQSDGADGIEFDVQPCASGELVVFHDRDLARLAGRGEQISSMTLADIATVTIGRGERIPTLDQVLGAFAGSDFAMNVEVKLPIHAASGPVVARVIAALARHAVHEQVVVSSFNPFVIRRLHRARPQQASGYLFHGDEPLLLRRAWKSSLLRPHALHVEHPLMTAEQVQRWRQRGFAVATWTVDTAADIQRVARLGPYALISNDPGHARRVLAATPTPR